MQAELEEGLVRLEGVVVEEEEEGVEGVEEPCPEIVVFLGF